MIHRPGLLRQRPHTGQRFATGGLQPPELWTRHACPGRTELPAGLSSGHRGSERRPRSETETAW